jgi:adenylate cyclase
VQSSRRYVSPYDIAFVYAGLGDKDKLFQWLNKAAEDRSTALAEIKVHPRFDKLRKDPRFQDLLRRLGLPETDRVPQS